MVSCSASHVNVPAVDGVIENAACTELVSIGLLNRRTTDAATDTLVAACDGTWLVITGSSGNISDWAMYIFAVMLGTVISGVALVPSGSCHDNGVVGVEQVDEHRPGGIGGGAIRQCLAGTGGVEADEDLLVAEHAGIGKQTGTARVVTQIVVHARAQRGIKTSEIVKSGHLLEQRMRLVEVVAHGGGVRLPFPREHVFAVVVVVAVAAERLLGAVVQTRNTSRGIEELQGNGERFVVAPLLLRKRGWS